MHRLWYTVKPLVLAVLAFGVWAIMRWDIWAFAGLMGLVALSCVAACLRQRWRAYPGRRKASN